MEKSRTLVLMASMRSPTIGSPDQTTAPLSSGAREWGGVVGEHGSVDDVGEPAFEDAEGFHTAVAVVFAPVEQFTSWWVEPCSAMIPTVARVVAPKAAATEAGQLAARTAAQSGFRGRGRRDCVAGHRV